MEVRDTSKKTAQYQIMLFILHFVLDISLEFNPKSMHNWKLHAKDY